MMGWSKQCMIKCDSSVHSHRILTNLFKVGQHPYHLGGIELQENEVSGS